ncbi:MAG: 4-hydroxybutyrate--acetyl-CoA CoA transferase [Oscillospiraceae bacterium]|nr:4-hydroxybutyrate--acetyl-CoA CoA transferase [Oscillospiraceae bacterium]
MSATQQYQDRLRTPEQIAADFESGWVITSDAALAAPKAIYTALGARATEGTITDVTMNSFIDFFPMPCYNQALADKVKGFTWFSGPFARMAVNSGFADLMLGNYRDGPGVVREYMEFDAFCITVSPMDKHGYFSTGCSASLAEAFISKSKRIYLEVNPKMPRALSGPIIHISQVTALCEVDAPLFFIPMMMQADETSTTIGNLIAEQVPNGATLQLGIGAIPNEVAKALEQKRDLGIHTEMLTDGMIGLLECGAVNNSKKPIHTGRTVATFALGAQRIYDYIDDNPSVLMLPVDYVNDPAVIAMHPNFISVNAAIEVDFFGQVSAETIGTRHHSGTGGQHDFVRGAWQSKGGQSFIAIPSTSTGKDGVVRSKINSTLTPGAVVSTPKNDVDMVVTEFGIAKLRGRSLGQRTKALIEIAHPDFRDQLTFEAKKRNIML